MFCLHNKKILQEYWGHPRFTFFVHYSVNSPLMANIFLLFFKSEMIPVRCRFNGLARPELPREYFDSEWVFHKPLDSSLQGPRSEGWIESIICEPLPRCVVQDQRELPFRQAPV